MAFSCGKVLFPVARRIGSILTSRSKVLTRNNRQDVNILYRQFSAAKPLPNSETVTVYFNLPSGEKKAAKAKIGDNLLDVIMENNLDIDGFGACEGTLACSTCHLVFSQDQFNKIPEKATDEELDMLDLAFGLEDTSRLGCQVIVAKEMDGWEIIIPSGTADAR
ncbi:Adrenodoxin-like protein 2, mitochondrial [Lamellibrachia satsuma]|nr:Adrenodoxin-like protein 2, mitochondrial [Lamellibrachia satsuma]